MTPIGATGVDHHLDAPSTYILLQLALGVTPRADADWPAVLALAERERLLGVAWKRSGDAIRGAAPAETSARWQRLALLQGLRAERQLELARAAVAALADNRVDVVVLKGAPLAQRVYGDFTVRPSLDVDLYVPAPQREAASDALTGLGWRHMYGTAPEEETFECEGGTHPFRLEVHSTALDDALLDHVQFPVEQRPVVVADESLPAQDGRFLPAYLAAHLAKHHEKPLLWALDFHLFWSQLHNADRDEAMTAAREVGLARHLGWAIEVTDNIAAARFDFARAAPALRRLARALAVRGDAGRVFGLIALSGSVRDALKVIAGRMWPAAWRQGWRHAPGYFLRRAVRWTYRHLVFERPSAGLDGDGMQRIPLAGENAQTRLTEALASAPVWVMPADASMEPAIPPFGAARVLPLERRPVRLGDVVVARGAQGRSTLQRVVALGDETLSVKPDAQFEGAQLLLRTAVLGVCDVVDVGGRRVPIERRPYGSLGLLRAIVRERLTPLALARHE